MKIGFVYDALYPYLNGGAEKRYHELARRLAERHEVHWLTWRFWEDEPHPSLAGITLRGVGRPGRLYGEDGKRTVREAASYAARIVPQLLRERYDVIDCSATPYLPLYAAWMATRISRTPLVATWHEFWGDHWDDYLAHRPAVARVARALEAGATRLGDRIVAVSPFTARRMSGSAQWGERVRVVGNGVDLAAIETSAGTALRSSSADVLFVGRLIEDKRVDLLLRAIARLGDELPDLRCTVVGDGPERAPLESLAIAIGVADRVSFVGRVADGRVFAEMKAARVLAFPSVREGYGITVAEAQACGLVPVVAVSEHSAASELVRDGIDGLHCQPTEESLATALARLLGDSGEREAMRKRAREAAKDRSWDRVTEQMELIYTEVVAHRSPSLTSAEVQP